MTDAKKLAESLRAMRRNARLHYNAAMELRHSITMDSARLGDLTDAADLIERLAAEINAPKDAPAMLLSDADLVQSIDGLMDCGLVQKLRAVESAVLAANGKAVS